MNSDNHTSFHISQKEIERRKKAFVILFLSLLIGFLFAALITKSVGFFDGLFLFLSFAVMFVALGLLAFASFRGFSKIIISLDEQQIVRVTDKARESYLIKEIENIFVKRTSYGNIREMKITQKNGITFFVNALEDFDGFYEKLKSYFGIEVKVKEFSEPINYDHRFFYVFFGLVVGLSTSFLMSFFIIMDTEKARMVLCSVSLLLVVLGLLFMFTKPFSRRFGKHKVLTDFLFGSTITIIGCVIFFQYYF